MKGGSFYHLTIRTIIAKNPIVYETLQIHGNATAEEIKKAYIERSKATHPDHSGGSHQFLAVRKAYEILRSPTMRPLYDQLTLTQYLEFSYLWKNKYNVLRDKLEASTQRLDRCRLEAQTARSLTLHGVSNQLRTYGQVVYYTARQCYYNQQVIRDDQETAQKLGDIDRSSRHVFFLLDISPSMFEIGSHIRRQFVPNVEKCLNNLQDICQDLCPLTYRASLITFRSVPTSVAEYRNIEEVTTKIKELKETFQLYGEPNDTGGTNIYDSLELAVQQTQKRERTERTVFVLFTDGENNSGERTLRPMIEQVKRLQMHLIVITLNINYNNDMRALAGATPHGQLLSIWEQYQGRNLFGDANIIGNTHSISSASKPTRTNQFQSIDDAFARTKELIISSSYAPKEYLDIRKTFGL